MAPAFRSMMRRDRERQGLRVCWAAWLLGVSVRRYRELEEGEEYPNHEEWIQMVDVFGWPRSRA